MVKEARRMTHPLRFTRSTGPSGWIERDDKRIAISGWEIVQIGAAASARRGWFRCTSNLLDARAGEDLRLHLRNWDRKEQEVDVVIDRVRDGGAIWEFRSLT